MVAVLYLGMELQQSDQIWWNFATQKKFEQVLGHFLSNYLTIGKYFILWGNFALF